MITFHLGAIFHIITSKFRDKFYFKRLPAKNAHAIYIGYRDEKLKEVYKTIKSNARTGYTSTNILLHDQETAEQFKDILGNEGYLVKLSEKNSTNYKYELYIGWSSNDMNRLSNLLD
jgi:hypothetical protein